MTSAELPAPQFPAQLGCFKILSAGKLACRNLHAHRLAFGDCWVEISTLAWQQLNNNMVDDVKLNKNMFVLKSFILIIKTINYIINP